MGEIKHTPLPWKVVSVPHFDSGLVYTSVQPVNVDEEAMKPLAMANGEYHVCRMSHTAAEWRFAYHRANASFIVEACNAYYENQAALASHTSALAERDAEIAQYREALKDARSQAIDDTLAALTAHELYQYRPKAFQGFIAYAETLKDEANAQLWRVVSKEPTP